MHVVAGKAILVKV